MMTAEIFNRSFTPAPDATIHVAPLKRPPLALVIAFGVIAAVFGLIVWAVLAQAGQTPSMQGPMPFVIATLFGVFGLYFLLTFINGVVALNTRGSWGNRECVGLGRSGIVLRTQGGAVDIPWQEVTAVRAMHTNTESVRRLARAHVPVLRLERGDRHWDIGVFVLDAAPVAVYAVLHYYWTHPSDRAELGTTFAQQRMDLQAGVPPTSLAPGVTRYGA
ncbi:hypothetical protein [Microbacterium sp. SORGH_AS_0888]|uniref:hypothetical protein n=1 Tax=Microbacterium sp. SORGH_AS_0888 TaxID=3041791 RepID=UPI0027802D89|nr:hypothetical protein [Microbacterium sp. SORGH_AS_0888]MDQ1128642.1 hypothetical protein [Microbacterium sp. SORGH_AS_0888]